jgi:hypothetical protein
MLYILVVLFDSNNKAYIYCDKRTHWQFILHCGLITRLYTTPLWPIDVLDVFWGLFLSCGHHFRMTSEHFLSFFFPFTLESFQELTYIFSILLMIREHMCYLRHVNDNMVITQHSSKQYLIHVSIFPILVTYVYHLMTRCTMHVSLPILK